MEETGTTMDMTTTLLQSIITSVTGTIDVTTMIGFLAVIIPIACAFALMWWGARKALSTVFGSIRSGRVNS